MKKRRIRAGFLLLLCLALLLSAGSVLSACGTEGDSEGTLPPEDVTPPEDVLPQDEEAEEGIPYPVTLYFANDEYAETGDPALPPVLAYDTTITIPEDTAVLAGLLEGLKTVPEEAEGLSTIITEDMTFLDVFQNTEEGTIYVDVSSQGLNGGSLSEEFFILQIVETLLHNQALTSTETYSPDKVMFLVDGQEAETVMGHYSANEAFSSTLE